MPGPTRACASPFAFFRPLLFGLEELECAARLLGDPVGGGAFIACGVVVMVKHGGDGHSDDGGDVDKFNGGDGDSYTGVF